MMRIVLFTVILVGRVFSQTGIDLFTKSIENSAGDVTTTTYSKTTFENKVINY